MLPPDGNLRHVHLDVLPDIERLAATEGPDVMPAFQQNAVLHAFTDGPCVVFDAGRQLRRRQVSAFSHFSLLQVNGTIRMEKERSNHFFIILNDIMEC
jgi:hypothetical protein